MGDELLTVLLQLKGDTRDIKAALAGVEQANVRVGKAAKKAAEEQESSFEKIRGGVMKVRSAFGEYTGAINVAKQVFSAMGGAADEFAKKNEIAGKSWIKASKSWDDGISSFKEGIGSVVVKLAPLLNVLGKLATAFGDTIDLITGGLESTGRAMTEATFAAMARSNLIQKQDQARNVSAVRAALGESAAYEYERNLDREAGKARAAAFDAEWAAIDAARGQTGMTDAQYAALLGVDNVDDIYGDGIYDKRRREKLKKYGVDPDDPNGKRKGGGIEVDDYTGPRIGDSMFGRMGHDFWGDEAAKQAPWAIDAYGRSSAGNTTGLGGMAGDTFPDASQLLGAQERMAAIAAEQADAKRQTYLESVFGTTDEFDAYGAAFNTLTDAVGGAYDAWINGTMGVGAAIKGIIKQNLAAYGKEAAVNAVIQTAWGFASLAKGSPLAAAHFKSAAGFAAGAAAAGVAAKAMGGGGGAAPSGGGGYGANLGGGGGGGMQQGIQTTIIVGDYFGSNPREQNGRVARALRSARKESADYTDGGVRDG